MMQQRMRVILLLFLLQPLTGRISYSQTSSQTSGSRPLSSDQVLQLWQEESANRLPKNRTRQLVDERGVDFVIDATLEQEMRRRNIGADVINLIRSRVNISVLTVECEPVDCTVSINKVSGGESPARTLTKSVTAGTLDIEVRAPERKTMSDRITIEPGQYVTRRFHLEPLTGSLMVNCEPADCELLVNGISRGATAMRSWEVNALTTATYAVEVRAEGYKPARVTAHVTAPDITSINLKMDVDAWAQLNPPQLLDRMVASLGSSMQLNGALVSRNTGRMMLKDNSQDLGNWNAQVVESAAAGKQRWDLKIAGKNWNVVFDGIKTGSKGDKKFSGTAFGQELEVSIRLFSKLRLPSILSAIQNGFNFRKDGTESAPILIAESATDRYRFRMNDAFIPQSLLHEHLVVPRSAEEMEYGDYRQIQTDIRLPHSMVLRYPDRPNLEQIFEFDEIDLEVAFRDSVFKP
jgi:hypothetical protein